jgi:hypothetical protein
MGLDIRTLILAISLCTGISALVLYLLHRLRFSIEGTFQWVLGGLSLTISLLFLAQRGTIPDWITMVLANMGIFWGFSFFLSGMRLFLGRDSLVRITMTLPLIALPFLIWCSLVTPSTTLRIIIVSVVSSLLSGLIAYELLKSNWAKDKLTQRFTGIVFAFNAVYNLIRILVTAIQGSPESYLHSGSATVFFYLYSLVFVYCYTAGMVLMISEKLQFDLNNNVKKLQNATDEVKILSGILPICANCKKIRDDEGYWQKVEGYIQSHSEAQFSHGICPDCVKEFYPDYKEG